MLRVNIKANNKRKNISFKSSTYKTSTKDDNKDTSGYSSKGKEMRMFVRRYNHYMRKMDSSIMIKTFSTLESTNSQ